MIAQPTDLTTWFSTYGLLTAERILDRFNIHLKHEQLTKAVQDQNNIYFQLLRVPLKNIYNGIILAQACDYREYAQKLFVDYLVSGASSKPPSAPGAMLRDDLEAQRSQLVEQGEAFEQQEFTHLRLIAESQKALKSWIQGLPNRDLNPEHLQSLTLLITPYLEKTAAMHAILCDYRLQFYQLIIRSTELMQLLPDYRPDETKLNKNKAELDFDGKLGE